MLRRLALACALALLSAVPAHATQVVPLDLADAANAEPHGIAAQTAKLRSRTAYVVTISGTGSLWSPDETTAPVTCGAPEPGATITTPTPGRAATPPTVDAAVVYAAPRGLPFLGGFACVPPTPTKPPAQAALRMGVRGVLRAVAPIGGQPKAPAADHTYAYAVLGRGLPLQFQYADPLVYDNSGILTITVRTARECLRDRCLALRPSTAHAARLSLTPNEGLPCVFRSLPAKGTEPAESGLCA